MELELKHLRAIVALAQAGSFTRAALELRVSQPTFSRTIAHIEKVLGAPIAERSTTTVRLTEIGNDLVKEALGVLSQYDHLLARFEIGEPQPFRLGWTGAGLGRHTVALLRGWSELSPVAVISSNPESPVRSLLLNEIDGAIVRGVRSQAEYSEALVAFPLLTERLVAAVPRSLQMARLKSVSIADLASNRIALSATAPTVSLEFWADHGHTGDSIQVANIDEWLTQIALGAVGVTSAATASVHRHPEVIFLPVTDSPEIEVSLLWNNLRPHPSAMKFAEHARNYFQRLSE